MKKLYIAILYHQHQPLYKELSKNYYYLPWVRLHAIKDYYDMLIWTEKYEKLKLNFNFVPSLLVQLEDYAKDAVDKHLELTLKPVSELNDEDKFYILKNFFKCNWQTMLDPYKRYDELLEQRGENVSDEEIYRKIKYFNNQDWLDLQVWSNLVWFDPYWRKVDNDIKTLFDKEKNYTEGDKHILVKKQREICELIPKKLKELQQQNKIEVSVSAFYHPILPILCDPEKAKVANPHVVLPHNYTSLIEDAEKQIKLAKELYENLFSISPKGFWPSEGAVSNDVIPLLDKYNIKWFATDEEILKNSINMMTKTYPQKDVIYKHYQVEIGNNQKIYAIFRDREISDKIGFVYYKWNYIDAVKDIEKKLIDIYNKVYNTDDNSQDALVSIILDGENCWEFYQNDGNDFLNELYKMLTEHKLFETVLVSDFVSSHPKTDKITTIWPGSWINANYNIWIGHPEDNTAWECLYKTRNFLIEYLKQNTNVSEETKNLCWQEIYIAEGSDWYWWFGDEHYTQDSQVFDMLFRQNLKNVYMFLGEQQPSYLDVPIKKTITLTEIQMPSGFILPKIDGKISSYFEWSLAGKVLPVVSSMHQTTKVLSCVYFGYSTEDIYIRIDYGHIDENISISIYFYVSSNQQLYHIKFELKKGNNRYLLIQSGTSTQELDYIKIDKVVELKVPFSLLKTSPTEQIKFFVLVEKSVEGKVFELERLPINGMVEIVYPDSLYIKQFWNV
jgi:alpha-amylase/alpha-mannosidase (GH57 family)